jgi:hypothetical protein
MLSLRTSNADNPADAATDSDPGAALTGFDLPDRRMISAVPSPFQSLPEMPQSN